MADVLDRLRGLAESPPTPPEPLDGLRRRAALVRRRRRWAGVGTTALVATLAAALVGGGVGGPVVVDVGGPTTTPPVAPIVTPPIEVDFSRMSSWAVPLPPSGGFTPTAGRPHVVDDLLLVSGGPRVIAYRANSGARVWQYDGGAFIEGVGDGIVIAAPQYGHVVALDLATGSERWRFDLPAGAAAERALVSEGRVYVGTSYPSEGATDAPVVYALDQETGTLAWRTVLDPGTRLQWSPPVLAGGLLMVTDAPSRAGRAPTAHVHGLDAATGRPRWRADLGSDVSGFHEVWPLLTRDTAYVAVAPGSLVAVDLATGAVRWRLLSTGGGVPVAAGPVQGQLIVALGNRLSAVDPATGREIWNVEAEARYGTAWPISSSDTVYLVERSRTRALAVPSGRVLWEVGVQTEQAPTWTATTLYLAGPDGLVAVEMASGRPEWAASVRARAWTSTLLANGSVLVPADGTVTAFPR